MLAMFGNADTQGNVYVCGNVTDNCNAKRNAVGFNGTAPRPTD